MGGTIMFVTKCLAVLLFVCLVTSTGFLTRKLKERKSSGENSWSENWESWSDDSVEDSCSCNCKKKKQETLAIVIPKYQFVDIPTAKEVASAEILVPQTIHLSGSEKKQHEDFDEDDEHNHQVLESVDLKRKGSGRRQASHWTPASDFTSPVRRLEWGIPERTEHPAAYCSFSSLLHCFPPFVQVEGRKARTRTRTIATWPKIRLPEQKAVSFSKELSGSRSPNTSMWMFLWRNPLIQTRRRPSRLVPSGRFPFQVIPSLANMVISDPRHQVLRSLQPNSGRSATLFLYTTVISTSLWKRESVWAPTHHIINKIKNNA